MIDRTMVIGMIGSVAALIFIVELVRQRRLREEYSLLWLATGAVLFILSLSRPLLDVLAAFIGIVYPPSALFVVAVMFVLLILLHFSTVITRLTQENKEIAQQVAILRYELETLRTRNKGSDGQQSDQDQPVDHEG